MGTMRVVVTDLADNLLPEARALLEAAGAQVVAAEEVSPGDPVAAMRDAEALYVFFYPLTADVLAQLARCKIIQRCGIGYDNVDTDAAAARGIPVCNVPDYCIDEVAEHALSMALYLARRLHLLDAELRAGRWKPRIDPIPAFSAQTFGIAGFGRIGRATAQRARALGFSVIAYDPLVGDDRFAEAGVERVDRAALLARADVLSLHLPLNPGTRHFIDARALAAMKPSAALVNVSRGPLIDTRALADALVAGRILGAGIDVFEVEPLEADHPLRAAPNAVLTPHMAWHSAGSGLRLQTRAAQEIVRALKGEPLQNRVNPIPGGA